LYWFVLETEECGKVIELKVAFGHVMVNMFFIFRKKNRK
jgi:hypothetical protein